MDYYVLTYYYKKQHMSEFNIATNRFAARSDEAAAQKSLRKMKRKAGERGHFMQKTLSRIS